MISSPCPIVSHRVPSCPIVSHAMIQGACGSPDLPTQLALWRGSCQLKPKRDTKKVLLCETSIIFHEHIQELMSRSKRFQNAKNIEKQEYHENTMTTFFTSRPPTAPQSTNMVHFAAPVGGNAYLGSKSCWQRYIQDHSVIHSGCFEDFSWISHVAVTFQTFSDNGNIWKWHVHSGSLT